MIVMGMVAAAVFLLLLLGSCGRLPKKESRLMLCRAVLVRDLVLLLLSGLLHLLLSVLTMELGNAGTKADTANNVEAAVRSRARVRGWCMAGWLDWTRCRYARGTRR